MELSKTHLVWLIIILVIVWVYATWGQHEGEAFADLKYWKPETTTLWKPWWYNKPNPYYPIVPSIVNYDPSQFHFPQKSIDILKHQEIAQHDMIQQPVQRAPVAQNVPTEQSELVGTSHMPNFGAPINEVIQQELQPVTQHPSYEAGAEESIIHEIKPQTQQKLQQLQQAQQMQQMQQMQLQSQPMPQEQAPVIVQVKKPNYNFSIALLLIVVVIYLIYSRRQ